MLHQRFRLRNRPRNSTSRLSHFGRLLLSTESPAMYSMTLLWLLRMKRMNRKGEDACSSTRRSRKNMVCQLSSPIQIYSGWQGQSILIVLAYSATARAELGTPFRVLTSRGAARHGSGYHEERQHTGALGHDLLRF